MTTSNDQSVEIEGKSFEELLQLLDESVQVLEANELTLDESIATYERSVILASACNSLLDNAELRIEEIEARASVPDIDANDDSASDDSVPF